MKEWNEVLEILEAVIEDGNYIGGLNTKEIETIMSILKNNVPFEVIENMRKQIKDRNYGK